MRRCCASRSRTGCCRRAQLRKLARHRPQVRPRLRPLLHAPEPAAQLAAARGGARDPRRARDGADARDPDLGQLLRNITTDHFAGVAHDEIVDSFVWCEILRQWSTFHPEFSYLPRKFKIAVNGASADRAAVGVHDIGLHAMQDEASEIGFRVLVGGGLGRTPIVGARDPRVPALAAPAHLPRGDPARLQPLRPARQHPQGAHQDPGEGARRRRSSARKSRPNGRTSRTARRR